MKKCLLSFVLLLPFFSTQGQSVTLTTLYSFTGGNDGDFSEAGLVQGADGNFYGNTAYGGAAGNGTVFKITPSGTLTTLYSFTTNSSDGWSPFDTLVQGTDGNFYGTTWVLGRVFRITPLGDYAILASSSGRANGLAQGNDGNFYGTTYDGGGNNSGKIFQVTTTGTMTVISSFNGVNGQNPYAGLVPGNDGNFYGTTYSGGDAIFNGHSFVTYGTVFKVTTNGVITRLFSFNGANGANPYANLVQGSDGNFYGTTTGGGANGKGTIFRITSNGNLTSLHSFSGDSDPEGNLIQASDGNFYGTTVSGTIFQMTPSGTKTTITGLDGGSDAGLLQGSDGAFYGTTSGGGTYGNGSVFRLTVPLAPVLKAVSKSSNAVAVSWSSVSGLNYQVQYRTNLAQTNWGDLGGVVRATNGTMSVVDSGATDGERFYRVGLRP